MLSGQPEATSDVVVVGGGIIGVATALELTRRWPGISVTLVEKEASLAAHQTGHNSGVIHAGVYYAPGSLKAEFCRRGSQAIYEFAAEHGIAHERCGKLIVATTELEVERLQALKARCEANGLDPEPIDAARLRELEPNISGLEAIRVASSGIVDYPAITRAMADIATGRGVTIRLGEEVIAMSETMSGVSVTTDRGRIAAGYAIVCAGLMADRLAGMCDLDLDFRVVPFRGEYYRLPERCRDIVRHLIYPVPDPDLPFLGVHLTRMVGGYITVGPNAVLALAREGYRWRDVNLRDLGELARFGGFWRTLRANARSGLGEMRNSIWRRGYLQACRKYCPSLRLEDLTPYPAGVRAQAVGRDGTLLHDFLVRRSRASLHVCNAPSPAATSSMPIAQYVVDQFGEAFGIQPANPVAA